ncbi:uncharacterized protein LOC109534521 [Dendroctonus ponderosae]|uniref:uncharacterized protein LOC109534521 n=1 Tax=Dendroctonus ponderosae TaxID=77166 RepID=UPI002035BC73|nr:uncharacterized protein LOC109534521 [Dendroctonus ponderosae]KAH1010577.1 hypothetical protein HUJ05_004851 [Dendroctonus ponderosae]
MSRSASKLFLLFNLCFLGQSKMRVPNVQEDFLPKPFRNFYRYCSSRAGEVSIIRLEYRGKTDLQTGEIVNSFYRNKSNILCKNYLVQLKPMELTSSASKIEEFNKLHMVETRELMELKPDFYNCDSSSIQVIIAKDASIVYDFIKSHKSQTPFETVRGLKILIFPNSNSDIKSIKAILAWLWTNCGVLNVIVLLPSSVKYRNFYITYKPFTATAFGHGQIQIQHLKGLRINTPGRINTKIPDLQGYPLIVSFFERISTAFRTVPNFLVNSKIYRHFTRIHGVDGLTIEYLAQTMNFSMKLCNEIECQYFGLVLDNKTVIGSLGKVVERKVDFQANSRFLMDYGTDDIEFTTSYMHDKICVLVPKAKLIPTWIKVLRIFKLDTKIVFLLAFIAAAITSKLTETTMSLADSVLEIYILMLQQPVDMDVCNKHVARRCFMGSSIIFFMIVSNIFIGGLFAVFGVKAYYSDINTLEEVDASGMDIKTSVDPFKGSSLPLYKRLSQKLKMELKSKNTIEFVLSGHGASLERSEDTQFRIIYQYVTHDGTPLLHMVPDCPTEFNLAYIVPKGSPHLPAINHILSIFLESGLTLKWYVDVLEAIRLNAHWNIHEKQRSRKALSLNDVQAMSWILIWGFGFALLAFLLELSIHKISNA